jgi:uncharacterized RDD family membrane protein YckC
MKLAKIRHRVIATIVDNAIILFTIGLVLVGAWSEFFYALLKDYEITISMFGKILRAGMLYALFLLSYYMLIPIFLKGQTLGKWLFKLKIVSEDGNDIDYKTLFFREGICRILVRTISLGISSVVSFFVMVVREDKKSLADVFAKTKVIDIKEEV